MNTELIAEFTPENFGEWCREKFDRFTSDIHGVSDSGGFARADIVGPPGDIPSEQMPQFRATSGQKRTPVQRRNGKVGQAFLPAQDAQTGMSAPPLSAPPSKKKARKSVLTEDPDLA